MIDARAVVDAPRGLFAGLTTVDVIHRLDRLPGPDEKVTACAQEVLAGGPAAVAAIAFAALGGRPTLVTALGTHPLAEVARADLRSHGVDIVDVAKASMELPVSAVRVHAGSGRRSVSSPDATGAALAGLDPPGDLPALAERADVVLLDGHYPRLAVPAASAARAAGTAVMLDAGRWRPVFADLLSRADFVISSAAFEIDGATDPLAAVLAAGVPAVARSDGARPIRWAVSGTSGEVAVAAVAGADTLGAGDVLHGAAAFAVACAGGGPALAHWPQVLRFAADVATVRVGHVGARLWLEDPRLRRWAALWLT